MDWVLALLILCALLIGTLGIAVVVTFFVLGASNLWFIYLALGMGLVGGGLFLCTLITLTYLLWITQKGKVSYVKG